MGKIYKAYVQQLWFDGRNYSKGSVVDILDAYNIAVAEFPFKKNPKVKALPSRDWAGTDGLDVYVPVDGLPINSYDLEVTFLYVGTENTIREDLSKFIDFLCGRIPGKNTDSIQSGRLAIYDEHVGMGRKDVVVSEVDNELFYCSEYDKDAVAKFKVKFTVYDPTTDVRESKTNGVVTNLSWGLWD